MPFQLTPAHIQAVLGPTAQENWTPFLEALDPNVNWMVNDPTYNELSKAGTYVILLLISSFYLHKRSLTLNQNLQTWRERIQVPVMGRLKTPVRMEIDTLEIFGLKAIVEASGFATQK